MSSMSVSLVIYLRVSFKYGECDYEVRYNHIVAVEINKATGSDLYNGHCLETGTKICYTLKTLLWTIASSILGQGLDAH